VHRSEKPSGPMTFGSSGSAYFLNNEAARSGVYGSTLDTEACLTGAVAATALGLGGGAGSNVGDECVGVYNESKTRNSAKSQRDAHRWHRLGRTGLVITVDSFFNVVRREAK
jgi:hypothetical protein